MKAVMYHYVRTSSVDLPYFRYLHVENFRKQLDFLAGDAPVIPREMFLEQITSGKAIPGTVLTFDDGFVDDYRFVFSELKARSLWGIFYVPTAIFSSAHMLDVHRIHTMLGNQGGANCLAALKAILRDEMLSHNHVEEFHTLTYFQQDNDEATTLFKRIMNYFVSYEYREELLDKLMGTFFPNDDERDMRNRFYMSQRHVREMHEAGMLIGSHGVNHLLMSKLDRATQRREIEESFATIADITGVQTTTFCYPYGGFYSFTAETEELLEQSGSRFSFNVEARDIADQDLVSRRQALPRYDCTAFPHGKSHLGSMEPI